MQNNKDVLDITRELGMAIADSEEYKNLLKAEEDFYNDLELSKILSDLEILKEANSFIDKSNTDIEVLEIQTNKINSLQQSINQSVTMNNLKQAKEKYDKLFKNINNLISYMTDDESRVKITQGKSGCGGCGSSGGGCSKK